MNMWNRLKTITKHLGILKVGEQFLGTGSRWVPLLAQDIGVMKFLTITIQLALVTLLIHEFRIEAVSGLHQITGIIFFGFIVHAWLSPRYRLPFFLLLSMLAIEAVFGAVNAAWLIGIGLGLIGLCHLPVPFWLRVALVVTSACGLTVLQAGWFETSWSGVILPILASMFMFRLIIYLYDLSHEKTPASVWERLSYFFLLPNVCFPLFPVVDYQLFRRTYYNAEASEIYQKGVLWIFRGIMHLLLYRLAYLYITPAPSEVQGLGSVIVFIISSYLLYLRVSGLFHMIIGILCLFGFNLPETHRLYFLASGFNDVWRRLNIYWKDFMVKIFYYPVLMRTRRWGMTPARVIATLFVFLATWLLHSYQWFWLQGVFPITAVDGMYWGLLGGFVVVNTLWVTSQLRSSQTTEEPVWTWLGAVRYSMKVVGMFVLMSVLWSFWSSSSVGEWLSTVAMAGNSGPEAYGLLLAGLAGLVGVGVFLQYLSNQGWTFSLVETRLSFANSALYTSGTAILVLGMSMPSVHSQMGGPVSGVIASVQESRLNQRDMERMTRGYYEGLLDEENNYTSELWWSVQARKPEGWKPLFRTDAVRPGNGVIDYELVPSYKGTHKEAMFRTNRWGMRDKEYEKTKPVGTYRIALLGASMEMAAGVKQNETYEAILEKRLDRNYEGTHHANYEILNFAVGAYSVVQNAALVKEKIFSFDPDLVLYAVGSTESKRLLGRLVSLVQKDRSIPYPGLQKIVEKAGVDADMEKSEMRRRFEPLVDEMIQWSFNGIVAACRSQDVLPVLVYVPNTNEIEQLDQQQSAKLIRFAEEAGFIVLNLDGAFQGYKEESIRLAPWDWHLSTIGHQLVADRLYQEMKDNAQVLGLKQVDQNAKDLVSSE